MAMSFKREISKYVNLFTYKDGSRKTTSNTQSLLNKKQPFHPLLHKTHFGKIKID